MKIAAVKALAALTREPVPQSVLTAYEVENLEFGPQYIIPKPFDPRLRDYVPPAIAQAAVDSGAARVAYPKHYPPPPKL
jgi:malate dehydrogenase (oxaloacetate-decarboxylating)(NADP+)